MKNTDLSIVIPVFQSEHTLSILLSRLLSSLKQTKSSYEIIFVDDGSSDNSWEVLMGLHRKFNEIILIKMTKNFGQHNALMCGFAHANGKYIITLDDDLQNPPEEIYKLILKINQGYDIVYGNYMTKRHPILRNFGSSLIQFIYKKTFNINSNLTSFRIIRSVIVKNLLSYTGNYIFIDGLIAWQTDNIGYIPVRHDVRKKGKSNYSLTKLLILSLNMATNFSIFPLQISSLFGFGLSLIALSTALFLFIKKIVYDIPVTGYASLMVAILLFSGVQLITIGLIGEYIGRIHLNINQKPQYRIAKLKDKQS